MLNGMLLKQIESATGVKYILISLAFRYFERIPAVAYLQSSVYDP